MSDIEVTPLVVDSVVDMPEGVLEAISAFTPPEYDQWVWYQYRHHYVHHGWIGSHGEVPHCPVCGLMEQYWDTAAGEDFLACTSNMPPWRFAPCCSERCAEWSMWQTGL